MANTITANELKELIDSDEDYHLIDVLSPESYENKHIPTAINIPGGSGLVKKVEEAGVNKDDKVIVYCSSTTCGASPAAAEALELAGFTNVIDFEAGLAGWQEAGYEFAS